MRGSGVDDPVERLGGFLAGGEHPDVINHDELRPADAGHDPGDGGVDLGSPEGGGERLEEGRGTFGAI